MIDSDEATGQDIAYSPVYMYVGNDGSCTGEF